MLEDVIQEFGRNHEFYDLVSNDDTDSDGRTEYEFSDSPRDVLALLRDDDSERENLSIGESEHYRCVGFFLKKSDVETGGVLIDAAHPDGTGEPLKLTRPQHGRTENILRYVLVEAESDPRSSGDDAGGGETGDDGFTEL